MSRIAEAAFGDQPVQYPDRPGWKEPTTSRAAARIVATKAGRLRDAVLAVLKVTPSTADEVAAVLGKDILAVRPRLSELREQRKIEPTGERRPNSSGVAAMVWRSSEGT